VISCVCEFVCVSLCVSMTVYVLKEKCLELQKSVERDTAHGKQ